MAFANFVVRLTNIDSAIKIEQSNPKLWRAPIGWTGAIISASWAFGPLGRNGYPQLHRQGYREWLPALVPCRSSRVPLEHRLDPGVYIRELLHRISVGCAQLPIDRPFTQKWHERLGDVPFVSVGSIGAPKDVSREFGHRFIHWQRLLRNLT